MTALWQPINAEVSPKDVNYTTTQQLFTGCRCICHVFSPIYVNRGKFIVFRVTASQWEVFVLFQYKSMSKSISL